MTDNVFSSNNIHWHHEHITPDTQLAVQVEQIIFEGDTPYQSVKIQDTTGFGRTLVLDNKTQSAEIDEFIYHEALVHPSMITHKKPVDIFIAGGGEGATARETLAHETVKKVVMVDIDREVVELCKKFLPNHHMGSFSDPRLELHHVDAFKFLEDSNQTFDIAIIDIPDPLEGGPAYLLYTEEYYKLLKKQLNDDGIIVVQAGPTGPTFYQQCFSVVSKTIGKIFPEVFVYEALVPSFGTTWGFVTGSINNNPSSLSSTEVDSRIAERISNELKYYDGITHLGMSHLPKYLREAIIRETRTISKRNPLFVS